MKSAVDKALAEGKTLAEILAGVTTDPTLKTEQVEKINSADGYDLPCRGVPAATAVTADCFRYECQWKNNGRFSFGNY